MLGLGGHLDVNNAIINLPIFTRYKHTLPYHCYDNASLDPRPHKAGEGGYDNASFLNIKMAATGEEASNSAADTIVTEYATYEDYLDSQITPTDLFYLEVRL